MRDPVREAKEQFRDVINGALDAAVEEGLLPGAERPDYNIEIPADAKNGDLATNAAMVCARALHLPPRKIAEAVAAKAQLSGTCFERMEIAGPGFINVFYAKDWYAGTVAAVAA